MPARAHPAPEDELAPGPLRSPSGRPVLIEVMGPAGAGKTSLARALAELDPAVRVGLGVGRLRWFPFLVARVARSLPAWGLRYRGDRWFTWNELKSLAFLAAWLRAARGRRGRGAVVLDHGPLYRLARIRRFGPALVGSPGFDRWWRRSLEGWLSVLDLVVLLDAPDPVLLGRIGRRGHWYLSATPSEEERRAFLRRYREAFERVLGEIGAGGPKVLRLRSDLAGPGELAAAVLREAAEVRAR